MDKKPIILIPGIQGTKLASTNNKDYKTVWSGIKKYFSNIHILQLQFDGVSDKGAENIIEHADVENIAYSEIINYLRSLGYRVYIFGYDWRKSNVESAKELAIFVKKVQRKLNEPKVNFLTHSMGCLVLSAYMKSLNKDEGELLRTINKAIFTVPPFLGSVEASFNLTIGKSRLINSSDDFRKIGRTFPGLYELLPVYEGAYTFDDRSLGEKMNYYSFSSYWQQVENVYRESTRQKYNLIAHRLEELGEVRTENNFIFDLNQCSSALKERLLVIAGGGEDTKEKIFVRSNQGDMKFYFDYEKYHEAKDGDGTVPIASATPFKDSILTLKLTTSWLEKRADSRFVMADWHAFFLNNGRSQNIIKRFFGATGKMQGEWYESRGGKVEKM